MNQPTMKMMNGDGVMINLAEWPGRGRPVLGVHGLTSNARSFDVIAAALVPEHRLLAVDLRGRGLSDKPDHGYSLEHHTNDLAAVLTAIGLSGMTVMGHSLGAYIGLSLAAMRPDLVGRLVLVDGGAILTPEQWLKVAEGIKPALERLGQTYPSWNAFFEPIKSRPQYQPWSPALEAYFYHDAQEVDGQVRSRIHPEHIQEERANLAVTDISQFYPLVRCPVLILRATKGMIADDALVLPPEATAELMKNLPQSKLVNVEADHFSIALQPLPARDEALLNFLK